MIDDEAGQQNTNNCILIPHSVYYVACTVLGFSHVLTLIFTKQHPTNLAHLSTDQETCLQIRKK